MNAQTNYEPTWWQRLRHHYGICPKEIAGYNCHGGFERNECGWGDVG